MKKRLYRALPTFAMIVMLAGCGKDVDVESAETTVDTVETMETEEEETEDEEPKASYYTGYNHYIDPEEVGKTAESETEIKEEDQDAADMADETEAAASGITENKKEETKDAEQTQEQQAVSIEQYKTKAGQVAINCENTYLGYNDPIWEGSVTVTNTSVLEETDTSCRIQVNYHEPNGGGAIGGDGYMIFSIDKTTSKGTIETWNYQSSYGEISMFDDASQYGYSEGMIFDFK